MVINCAWRMILLSCKQDDICPLLLSYCFYVIPVKLKVCRWYQTGAHGWRINLWDPCLWIVISGHVGVFYN